MDRAYSNLSALNEEDAEESIQDSKRGTSNLRYMDSYNGHGIHVSSTAGEKTEEGACEPNEKVDEPNKFDGLCDGVLNATALVHTSLDELLELKNDLLKHSLPPAMMVKLTMVISKLFRSISDVNLPINELIRLVKVYSTPWEENSASLKKLHEDYERKQRQLNIAIRRLQLVDEHSKRIAREKRIMNWEKIFAKVTTRRGHGRRWKFLIDSIKEKAKLGYEHIEALREEMDESSDEEDEEMLDPLHCTPSPPPVINTDQTEEDNSEDDKEQNAVEQSITIDLAQSYTSDGTTSPESTPKKAQVMSETMSRSCWTQEAEYDWTLHARVFVPEGLDCRELWCMFTMHRQVLRTAVLDPLLDVLDPLLDDDSVGDMDEALEISKNKSTDSSVRKPPQPKAAETKHYEEIQFSVSESIFSPDANNDSMNLSVAVHYGPNEELVAMGTVEMDDIQLLDLPTVTLAPPCGDEPNVALDATEPQQTTTDLEDCEPVLFPLFPLHAGPKGSPHKHTGNIPLLFYWGKTLKPRSFNRQTSTQDVNELVLDLTGIDLSLVTKESLVKEMKDEAISTMSLTPEVHEETVAKVEYESLVVEHQEQMALLQHEYESRIKDLIEALHQTQAFQQASSVDLHTPGGTFRTHSGSSTHKSGENGRTLRLPSSSVKDMSPPLTSKHQSPASPQLPSSLTSSLKHKKNFRVGKRLPNWGEAVSQGFFERLEQYEATSQQHKDDLVSRICEQVSHNIEQNLAGQHRLNREKKITDPLQDVSLPALFMPLKTGTVYNARAHQYFHPTGSSLARLTQPPSVFQLPPLSKSSMANMNLFDLSATFHRHGPEWLMQRYIEQQTSTPTLDSLATTVGDCVAGHMSDMMDTQSTRQTSVSVNTDDC